VEELETPPPLPRLLGGKLFDGCCCCRALSREGLLLGMEKAEPEDDDRDMGSFFDE
jgi:hypothetical protein